MLTSRYLEAYFLRSPAERHSSALDWLNRSSGLRSPVKQETRSQHLPEDGNRELSACGCCPYAASEPDDGSDRFWSSCRRPDPVVTTAVRCRHPGPSRETSRGSTVPNFVARVFDLACSQTRPPESRRPAVSGALSGSSHSRCASFRTAGVLGNPAGPVTPRGRNARHGTARPPQRPPRRSETGTNSVAPDAMRHIGLFEARAGEGRRLQDGLASGGLRVEDTPRIVAGVANQGI